MFKNFTYKQKFQLLIGGGVLFFFLAYQLAIQSTLEKAADCGQLKEQLGMIQDAPEQIALTRQKLASFQHVIGNSEKGSTIHEELLDNISRFCQNNGLSVTGFPGAHQFQKNDYRVITSRVTVKGKFIPLLKLMYHVEKNSYYGRISSVIFQSQRDIKTRKRELFLTLFIQNINIERDEKKNR